MSLEPCYRALPSHGSNPRDFTTLSVASTLKSVRNVLITTWNFKQNKTKQNILARQWWCMPLLSALGRQRLVDIWVHGQLGLKSKIAMATQRNSVSKKTKPNQIIRTGSWRPPCHVSRKELCWLWAKVLHLCQRPMEMWLVSAVCHQDGHHWLVFMDVIWSAVSPEHQCLPSFLFFLFLFLFCSLFFPA